MSVPQRHVLSWDEPFLATAVEWLAGGWDGVGPLDLSDVWILVASRQAGRRLREALAARAAAVGQAVFAPRVTLPQGFEAPAMPGARPATKVEALLAWVRVLRALDPLAVPDVLPNPPEERSVTWALRLARDFVGLQERLVENALRISDVVERAGEGFPERDRWSQLAGLEAAFDEALAEVGAIDPALARIRAADAGVCPEGVRRVVLLGVLDAAPLVTRWLSALPEMIGVDVVVAGPSDASPDTRFDAWGRPLAALWTVRPLALGVFQDRVQVCADPAQQAEVVAACVTASGSAGAAPAVGVADPQVTPLLIAGLVARGWTAYDPSGRPHREGGLFHVLSCLHAWVQEPSFEHLSAVARCADVLAWLARDVGAAFSATVWLAGLDEVRDQHLPESMDDVWQHVRAESDESRGRVAVRVALGRLRALYRTAADRAFPENVQQVLQTLYGERRFDGSEATDAAFIEAAQAWRAAVSEVGRGLDSFPGLGPADAWELALRVFGDGLRFGEKPESAVELQGWIELLWEEAPHLIVTGMNEGFVPESVGADAFLPEGLRQRLGLRNNADKFARDACLLDTLAAVRRNGGRLDVLLGKFSGEGDPLRPSRLLLRCDDAELATRVRWLFRPVAATESGGPWQRTWRLAPRADASVDRVAVTGFRTYLKCPFRFYLRHALRMEPVDPFKTELDARDFGNLCHGALEAMGRDPVMAACADVELLQAFLLERLESDVAQRYGDLLPVPLQVQLESARQRLRKAAEVQIAQVLDGWRIERVESVFTLRIADVEVKGKIDRMDRHLESGRVRVLDYKTSDTPVSPLEAHVRRLRRDETADGLPAWRVVETADGPRVWTDLQIPLYLRALAAEFGPDVACGYFNLPKAVGETAIAVWDGWNQEWRAAAEACADGVAERIRGGVFWPPTELTASEVDDFATLFHRGVAESIDWRGGGAGEGMQ